MCICFICIIFFPLSFMVCCLSVIQWTSFTGGSGFCDRFHFEVCLALVFIWLFSPTYCFGVLSCWFPLCFCFFLFDFSQDSIKHHCLNSDNMSRRLTLTQLQIKQNNMTVTLFAFLISQRGWKSFVFSEIQKTWELLKANPKNKCHFWVYIAGVYN